jgi:hypothetical protein
VTILSIKRKQTDADTRGRKQLVPGRSKENFSTCDSEADRFDHVCRAVDLRAQQGKLVAAKPRHRV